MGWNHQLVIHWFIVQGIAHVTLDSLTHLSYPAAGVLPKVSLTAFVNGWLVDTLGPTKVTIISGEGRFCLVVSLKELRGI